MSVVTVDLTKNPEVAALVADMEPGAKVCGCFSIKSRDAQTLELRIEQMAGSKDELDMDDMDENDDAEEDKATTASVEDDKGDPKPAEKPGSMGRKLAARMSDAVDSGY